MRPEKVIEKIMVRIGDEAPNFTLKDENHQDVTLSSLIGSKYIVLCFYPGDFTYGCTKEVIVMQCQKLNILGMFDSRQMGWNSMSKSEWHFSLWN